MKAAGLDSGKGSLPVYHVQFLQTRWCLSPMTMPRNTSKIRNGVLTAKRHEQDENFKVFTSSADILQLMIGEKCRMEINSNSNHQVCVE